MPASRRLLARAVRAALAASVLFTGTASARLAVIDTGSLNGRNGLRFDGVALGDRTGSWVNAAGDLNDDGLMDFVVSSFRADANGNTDAGAVHVIFGRTGANPPSLALNSLDGSRGFRINGAGADDRLGFSAGAAGDLNGDGIDDLVIGSYNVDVGGFTNAGSAYVIYGRAGGFPGSLDVASLDGNNGFRLTGGQADDYAGFGVTGVGDFNGDGRDDLAVSVPGFDGPGLPSAGAAYVVFGRNSFPASLPLNSLDGSNSLRIDGATAGDFAGQRVASGDVNGDGRIDLVIGVPGANVGTDDSGSAYVLYGQPGPLPATLNLASIDGSNGFRLDGALNQDYAGYSVATADLNGDGFDDVIVASALVDFPGRPDAGGTYVVFGGPGAQPAVRALASIAAPSGFRFEGEVLGYSSVKAVSAGDVDGNGIEDLILTNFNAGPQAQGGAHIILGGSQFPSVFRAADLDGNNGFTILGAEVSEYSGFSVSGGDFNGDGVSDMLVGSARRRINDVDTGVAYLVFGSELFNDGFESTAGTGSH